MKRKCAFKTISGKPCQAWAQRGSKFCFFHDPEKEQVRKEARSRGGRLQPIMGHTPVPLRSAQDVAAFVADVINGIRTGKMNKTKASILSTLSQTLLRAIEMGELEGRLNELESKWGEKK